MLNVTKIAWKVKYNILCKNYIKVDRYYNII